ncbi:hypothetical protein BKA80DRAFT_307264 [Phyllosticta citrichinensis]
MSAIKHHPIFSLISPAATPPRPAPSDDDAVPLVNVPSSSSTPPEDVHKRVDPSATTPPPQKLSKKTPRRPATWKYISHGIGGAGNFHLRHVFTSRSRTPAKPTATPATSTRCVCSCSRCFNQQM